MYNVVEKVERTAVQALVDHFYDNIADPAERVKTLQKSADVPFHFSLQKEVSSEQIESLKKSISNPDSRLMQFFNAMVNDTDPEYAKKLIMALGYEAGLCAKVPKTIRKNRGKYKNATFRG